MIFGRYIIGYYFKFGLMLILGTAALLMVDYLQLVIPNLYQMVINGINQGFVEMDGQIVAFDMDFLLEKSICRWLV